jgi:hypothetical protein
MNIKKYISRFFISEQDIEKMKIEIEKQLVDDIEFIESLESRLNSRLERLNDSNRYRDDRILQNSVNEVARAFFETENFLDEIVKRIKNKQL